MHLVNHPAALFVAPVGAVNAGPCVIFPADLCGLAILRLELLFRQPIDHEGNIPVRTISLRGVRIAVNAERVSNPLDQQIHFKGVVMSKISDNAPITKAARDSAFNRRVIGHVGVRTRLDVADQAVVNFRRIGVCATVGRMNLDGRLVLPRVVDDLADECGQLVDGEAGTPFDLALLFDIFRPLLAGPRKFDVLQRRGAVFTFGIGKRWITWPYFSDVGSTSIVAK